MKKLLMKIKDKQHQTVIYTFKGNNESLAFFLEY